MHNSYEKGKNTAGRLYLSPLEILEINNIRSLLTTPSFHLAMTHSYRLQDWVSQIERMVIPVTAFVPSSEYRRPVGAQDGEGKMVFERLEIFLVQCGSLKQVRAMMWDGFREAYLGNEESGENMIARMKEHVTVGELELERWKSEVDGNYEVPEFVVI